MKEHECRIKPLVASGQPGQDEHEVSCRKCSYTYVATSGKFAESIKARHEQIGGSR